MSRYRASFLSVFGSESRYQILKQEEIYKVALNVTLWRLLNALGNHIRSSQQQIFDIF